LSVLFCLAVVSSAQSPQTGVADKPLVNVTLKDASQKSVIDTFTKQLGINLVFDDSVKNAKVNIELHDVTMEAALRIVLIQQRLEARFLDDKTIIVFPDSEASREKYKEHNPWPSDKE
jgi:general secretion pathway protein D